MKKARESLSKIRVLGSHADDNGAFVWWTGRPLRAFPHTVPREVEPSPLSPDLANAEIPF
jgi:hypothetical protein